MREILFRGKGNQKYNSGVWYYGVPIRSSDGEGENNMTLKELSQLYYLNREIESDKQRLENLDTEIQVDEARLIDLKTAAENISSPNYDGMPKSPRYGNKTESDIVRICALEDEIKRKVNLKYKIKANMQIKQFSSIVERDKLECYIADLPDSLLRLIFTYRFIDGLTWNEVSEKIGARTTEDGVKKMCYRYLNNKTSVK